ncbi:MAG: hypothetical protein KKG79_07860 [Acidobacteria bacterium]|nr:hypothetical protein [Acidobacteriota bacterium]
MKNKATAPGTVLAAKLRAKNDWRRRQAGLPFARKVEIVICLQKLAVEIGEVTGRKPAGTVWRLPSGKCRKGISNRTRSSKLSTRG